MVLGIIEQFCTAYAAWDERSNVGDVYLTPIMQYLGAHIRRGYDPHELGEYEMDDLWDELVYLTSEVHMDAAFLVAALIRAIEAELVATSEAYGKTFERLPQQKAAMDQLFEQHRETVRDDVVQGVRDVVESAWSLPEPPAGVPRKDQQRIIDWQELMAPVLARENLERAYAEQWGEEE